MTGTPLQKPPSKPKPDPEIMLSDLVREIEQIPRDAWVGLLMLIQLFRANLGQAALAPEEQWKQALEMAKVPNAERKQALGDLLQSWVTEGDGQEQKETWEFLRQALDEDRLSDRPLFP